MALLLAIDTAVETASVCLWQHEHVLAIDINENPKDHASWIQTAIKRISDSIGISLNSIDAVSVSIGPGSYTGLRVGLATAKGLCYALDKPLITINTLEMMAFSASQKSDSSTLLCPMIDARRMEVFTAVFKKNLEEIIPPQALVIDSGSFAGLLEKDKVMFFGNGSKKFSAICNHHNALFSVIPADASHLAPLSERAYKSKRFANLAYSEPLYLKEFHSTIPKPLV